MWSAQERRKMHTVLEAELRDRGNFGDQSIGEKLI
jgi:hypothetical protein